MKINEELLYYIWKCQYFDKTQLTTCQGNKVAILSPGMRNENAGPDFLDACVKIDDIIWHGHVELHTKSIDWQLHKHNLDAAYENVILHVVWHNYQPILRKDTTILPTLILENKVASEILEKCSNLLHQKTTIPCAPQFYQVPDVVKTSMLDKVLFQRLSHKNSLANMLLTNNQGDLEETSYQLLAYNLGFKINSQAMLNLSIAIPLKIIKKQRQQINQIEALLLGQAGLLSFSEREKTDSYIATLLKEYAYLTNKYKLNSPMLSKQSWNFFGTRPANFPTIRIAQLAQILCHQAHLFNWLIHTDSKVLRQQLAVLPSAYWQRHYNFGKASQKKIPGLGRSSIENILINTVVPLLVGYSKYQDEPLYLDKAIDLLCNLSPEHNTIISRWKKLGMNVQSAFDSQALLELFNHFCSNKKCLSCSIGNAILQPSR